MVCALVFNVNAGSNYKQLINNMHVCNLYHAANDKQRAVAESEVGAEKFGCLSAPGPVAESAAEWCRLLVRGEKTKRLEATRVISQ